MPRLKPCLACLLALASLILPLSTHAQNPGNGGTTFDGMQVTTRPEEFLGKFIESTQAEAAADAGMLMALGDEQAARRVADVASALDLNATPGQIGAANDATRAAGQRIAEMLAAHAPLTEAGKAGFASGALKLANATRQFSALTRNINATKQAMSMAGARGRIALFAARAAPEHAAQLRAQLREVITFAGANQVALAPEAGSAAVE